MSNTEHEFADTNRHLVEVPDSFAIARWPRDADVPTIARCILGTLKYEPHTADTTPLRRPRDLDRARTCHRSQIRGGAISDVQRRAARARDDESRASRAIRGGRANAISTEGEP